MSIGQLNRKVTIEVWGEPTQDDNGNAVQNISETFDCRANVKDTFISQSTNEGQQQWGNNITVKVRFGREIKSVYTLQYESKRYTINGIDVKNEGHKRWYFLSCSKTQNNG